MTHISDFQLIKNSYDAYYAAKCRECGSIIVKGRIPDECYENRS